MDAPDLRRLTRGLRGYHAELVNSGDLLGKFESMYEKYGSTGFGAMPDQ